MITVVRSPRVNVGNGPPLPRWSGPALTNGGGSNGVPPKMPESAAPRVGFVMLGMQVAGAEVLVAETIRRLGERIRPTILCLDYVGALGEKLRGEGVEVVCLGRKPGRDWRVAWRMAREIRARRLEVLHTHQYSPFFYAALARVLTGGAPRVILTEHGRHYPDRVAPLRRAVNRLFLDGLADEVNAVCGFSARSLSRVDGFMGRRIGVIENGIDVARYHTAGDRDALRRRLGLDPGRRYLINVARFHPIKDQATLLRGFAPVAAARPDADLLLAGDGRLRGDLEGLTGRLGLGGRVHFLGVRSDVPELLQAADLLLLTSICEAASLTLLEGMAAALPVVATAVGGNPELVRDGVDGILVPRGDAAAVTAAALRLLDDPATARRMGAAGRARVEERFQLAQTVAGYYRLYKHLGRRGRKQNP
jgi:glycosyltransferase involved in cell wall biosynthesis